MGSFWMMCHLTSKSTQKIGKKAPIWERCGLLWISLLKMTYNQLNNKNQRHFTSLVSLKLLLQKNV